MDQSSKLGPNRTGLATAPKLAPEMLEIPSLTRPSSKGDARLLAEARATVARELDPVGSMPPPTTVKGVTKTAVKAITGKRAHVLLDKLGERLAFERVGTRLYD